LSSLRRRFRREVKIDRSFVAAMAGATGSHCSEVLIKSIINLGSSLGLRMVAEGVETAELLEELRQMGCDVIQGYYIGRPMPADPARHWPPEVGHANLRFHPAAS
jgi:EAL domain-containing protein (putative c-di-GMP-specific phosphodiesterase class I)